MDTGALVNNQNMTREVARPIGNSFFENASNCSIQTANIHVAGGNIIHNTYHGSVPDIAQEHIIAIANWLTPMNYWNYHQDLSSRRTKATGTWFVLGDEFKEWERNATGVLWVTGMPGSGKSMLTSRCVEELHLQSVQRNEGPRSALVFAYCRYTDQCTSSGILAAFLRQLLNDHPDLLVPPMKALKDHHTARQTNITRQEVLDALSTAVSSFATVTVVVDGLDEIPGAEIVDLLESLMPLPIRLLIFSRPLELLSAVLPPTLLKLSIEAKTEDIQLFVADQIRRDPPLRKLLSNNESTTLRLTEKIVEKSAGMFLVAALQLEAIKGSVNIKTLMRALETLPSGIHDMYSRTLDRIQAQSPSQAVLAIQTLLWLTYAQRTLTMRELQHALATSYEPDEFDREALTPPETILSVCCGLVVTVNPVEAKRSGTSDSLLDHEVRLIHFTAQEHLRRLKTHGFSEGPIVTAFTCIAYLVSHGYRELTSSISWNAGPYLAEDPHESFLTAHPFAEYAEGELGSHAALLVESSTGQDDVLERLANSLVRIPKIWVPGLRAGSHRSIGRTFVDAFSFAVLHGLAPLLPRLQQCFQERCNLTGWCTPLHFAVCSPNKAIVQLILEDYRDQADVNAADVQGYTALSLSVSRTTNDASVFKLLLSHPTIDLTESSRLGKRLLQGALSIPDLMTRREVLQLLLTHPRFDMCTLYRDMRKSRVWDAYTQDALVFRFLLADPALDVNQLLPSAGAGLTLVHHIIHISDTERRRELLSTLLDRSHSKIDFNRRNNHNDETPLHSALRIEDATSRREIVKVLLGQPGVHINAKCSLDGSTPLHTAILSINTSFTKIHEDTLQLLLVHPRIDVNSQDDNGRTPLHHAVCRGGGIAPKITTWHDFVCPDLPRPTGPDTDGQSTWMLRLLLAHPKIQVSKRDMSGLTPLQVALDKEKQTKRTHILETLLRHPGLDVNLACQWYPNLSPLHEVVQKCDESTLELFVSHPSIDVNKQDGVGRTPLHHAVTANQSGDSTGKIQRLLQCPEINLNAKDSNGNTALHLAMNPIQNPIHQRRALQMLLSHPSIDVNSRNNKGETPLHKLFQYYCRCVPNTAFGEWDVPTTLTSPHNEIGIVTQVLGHPKIDIGAQTLSGMTALTIAYEGEFNAGVEALLSRGGTNPHLTN